jgi:hypothetical protein
MEEQNTFFEEWKESLHPEKAFSNNGEKIKKWARGLYVFYLAVYMIAGVGCIFASFTDFEWLWWLIFVGAVVIALAQPVAYLSTCALHGFGELVSNSYGKSGCEKVIETAKVEEVVIQPETKQEFTCYSCGNKVNFGDANCKNCGAAFDWSKV